MAVIIKLIYENYCLEVRWFKVRGLGDSQKQEIHETRSIILKHLEVAPLAFQQIRNLSLISPESLGKRLKELMDEGWIIRHKFGLPYTRQCYGYFYRHQSLEKFLKPPEARHYFFINILNSELNEQLKLYRNNLSRRRHKKTIPKVVSNMLEMLNEITINDTSDKIILSHFRYRQNEWLHLHQNTNLSRRLNSDIAKLLVSHIRHLESVLERKFSILDAIIRCCHQPTLIPKTEKESYVLPIFRFYDTVNILSETKYKSNLIVAFV